MAGTFIITGANGNLGTAVVRRFLNEGYHVIAVASSLEALAFAAGNKNFESDPLDLSDEIATAAFVRAKIEKHHRIDGAILLTGGFAPGALDKTDGNSLRKMFSLNFETTYHLSRFLFPHLLENGYGRIVMVGARPALKASQGKHALAYALSKSLVFKLAEFLNEEAKGKNIVTSVVVPSTIDTPPNRKSMPDANPDNWVRPEQIADLMELICSEKGNPLRETVLKIYNNS